MIKFIELLFIVEMTMGFLELVLIAIGLSMDAFAVSICKGLSLKEVKAKHYFIIGIWFGGFQALMPTIGYFLGTTFESYINKIDHWVAFILLAIIGGNMVKESFSNEEEKQDDKFDVRNMFLMAVATSIDALAVGVAFGLLPNVNIGIAASLIGVITFTLSAVGLKIGKTFGSKYESKAEFAGGVILLLIGLKILLEHLGILVL